MSKVHNILTESAHGGHAKTYNHIASTYYWLRMSRDIKRYVSTCNICQKSKPKRHAPFGLLQPYWVHVAISIDLFRCIYYFSLLSATRPMSLKVYSRNTPTYIPLRQNTITESLIYLGRLYSYFPNS